MFKNSVLMKLKLLCQVPLLGTLFNYFRVIDCREWKFNLRSQKIYLLRSTALVLRIDAHTSSTRWRSFQVSLASLKKVYRHHFRNFRKKIVIYMKITISPLFRLHLEFVKWWSVLICILNVLFCSLSLFYAYTTFALLYCAVKIGQSQISASKQTPNTNLISIFFFSARCAFIAQGKKWNQRKTKPSENTGVSSECDTLRGF